MISTTRSRLLASTLLVAASAFASPAFAQTTPTGAAQENATTNQLDDSSSAEEVVVTGSRIARPNIEGNSPVSVVSKQDVELKAPSSAEQLLRDLPGSAAGVGTQVNNGQGGASTFNLRGLGTNRNLVLLNSRRVTPSGLGNVVDLNIIPLALIERAEIFTGGASSVYGADAVSGVVNFITRKDFSGVEFNGLYGITDEGDGRSFRGDLTLGGNFADGRGNATLALSYTKISRVLQGNRPTGVLARQSTCTAAQVSAGVCDSLQDGIPQGSNTAVPASVFYPVPIAGDPAFASFQADGGGRFDPATGTIVGGLSNYNFSPINIFQTPLDRWSMFGQAHYDITDNIQAYAESFFTRSFVRQELAPTGTFTNVFQLPLNNPFLTAAQASTLCRFAVEQTDLPAGTNCAVANTLTNQIPVIIARRFTETGPRVTEFVTNQFQFIGGLRGKLTDHLNWDIYGQYGESNRKNTSYGTALASRVQAALRGCPAGSPAGCVPINIFGAEGTLTPAMLNYVGVPTNTFIATEFTNVQGIVSGDLGFGSPFSDQPIGIAVGAEYRRYYGDTYGDLPASTPGEILGSGGAFTAVRGSYHSQEAYGELNIPLVTDRSFFKDLSLEAGARYADYSNSGGNWTYKVGGSWTPVSDIKFRGVYSKAVRAPNLAELFTPVSTGLANLATDPCQGASGTSAANAAKCTAQLAAVGLPASRLGTIPAPIAGQINTTGGGNPNLAPEVAKTLTAGIVLQPRWIPGLSATVDYYRIKVTGAITSPSISDILNGCFAAATAATDFRCTSIRRNPLTGGLSGAPDTTLGVVVQASNLGYLKSEGIDFGVAYNHDFGFVKTTFAFNGNYTADSQFQAAPYSFIRECTGYYSISCTPPQPKWSWNSRLTGVFGAVDASLVWRHINKLQYEPRTGVNVTTPPAAGTVGSYGGVNPATVVGAYRSIPSYNWFDFQVGVRIGEHYRISFLTQNLFDKDPPYVGNTIADTAFNSGNTFPSLYDALGRRFTVQATLKF